MDAAKKLPDPMEPKTFRIQQVRTETYDTFTLTLKPAEEKGGFSFVPGQFNMLYIFGVGEVPISISGDPAKNDILVHTVRAVGTVTRAMQKMQKGDVVAVRGPYGTSWPVEKAAGKDIVIVAGGIGLAPLRPSVYHVLSNRARYGKLVILYGARTPKDMLFVDEVRKWGKEKDVAVDLTVDSGDEEWKGTVGVVTKLIPNAIFDPANCVAMVVGPEVMMRYTLMELQKRSIPDTDIFISMERNMKCGTGFCGHCQLGGVFVCKDGPVFPFRDLKSFFGKKEI